MNNQPEVNSGSQTGPVGEAQPDASLAWENRVTGRSGSEPVQGSQSDGVQSSEDEEANGPKVETVEEPQPAATAELVAELAKCKDAALRARADLDNYRKRVAREKEDAIRYANNSLLESLLPILDNFELGLEAADFRLEVNHLLLEFRLRLLDRHGSTEQVKPEEREP